MKNSKLSRATEIDIEKCVKNSGGNKFNLVIMAAVRAREISRNHKNSGNTDHIYPVVDSLLEFQSGKIGPEYLKKVK